MKYKSNKKRLYSLGLSGIFAFMILNFNVFAVERVSPGFLDDSLKHKYSANDPRNPKCPCHSYQNKADKEFKKLKRRKTAEVISESLPAEKVKIERKTATFCYRKNVLNFLKRSGHQKKVRTRRLKISSFRSRFQSNIVACPHW